MSHGGLRVSCFSAFRLEASHGLRSKFSWDFGGSFVDFHARGKGGIQISEQGSRFCLCLGITGFRV